MREIKFRAWNKGYNDGKISDIFTLKKLQEKGIGYPVGNKDIKIMQYTGLKDKNNKEIYEGDIITNRDGIWEVKFIEEFASFKTINKNGVQRLDMCNRTNEVIGNIYKNPKTTRKFWKD